ncbi:acyl-CoA dehydrogenase family protein [Mesobacterium pallidum]|uniref:acyl-CoA dehydrogenase family protein n=1 Tax=Mesobacterium pallidum TaxID=2872037 RepID=UPI001EE2678A|nr:acyl-CoA dehydrogenase family protein [Mesobacterium pallidum]
MNFDLPEDVAAIVDTTKSVVKKLLAHEPEFQRTGVVPDVVKQTLLDGGYYTINFPEAHGGLGLGALATACVQAELAHLPPQFWAECRALMGPGSRTLLNHGTEAQQEEWLPRLMSGEIGISIGITEPQGGSDISGMRTTAVKDGNGWRLNGEKTYISNGLKAGVCFVLAYTDKSRGPKGGMSLFIVPRASEGYKVAGTLELMGTATPGVAHLTFDDIKLPADALVGEEGKGLAYVMEGLNAGRMSVGSTALGMGEFALELATDWALERDVHGGKLADKQAIQHMLADMKLDMHAARMVMYEATTRYDAGRGTRASTSMSKLICTEAGWRTVDKALQIFGGAGYVRGMIVERLYRDVRITRIYEGSSEVQRNTIAKEMLAA